MKFITFTDYVYEGLLYVNPNFKEILQKISDRSAVAKFLFDQLKKEGNALFSLYIEDDIKNVETIDIHPTKPDFLIAHFTKPNGSPAKQEVKVGKFLVALKNAMNDNKFKPKDEEIENFVRQYYATNKDGADGEDLQYEFRLVSGADIAKYYDVSKSEKLEGSLGKSCMRDSKWAPYLKFYEHVGPKHVQLLIYVNKDTDQILGRALIWNLAADGCFYMDRIYSSHEKDKNVFFEYGKKHLKVKYCYDFKNITSAYPSNPKHYIRIENWKLWQPADPDDDEPPIKLPHLDTFNVMVLPNHTVILGINRGQLDKIDGGKWENSWIWSCDEPSYGQYDVSYNDKLSKYKDGYIDMKKDTAILKQIIADAK